MGRKEGAGRVPPVFLRSLAKTQEDTSLRPLRLLNSVVNVVRSVPFIFRHREGVPVQGVP